MKVEINKPDTIQFNIRLEKEDELYTNCMWARITFDNKNWSMMAQSDCGDYSYSWIPEKDRTFLKLMQQIDDQYLLDKIANRSYFDEEESKKNLISWIDQEPDADRLEKEINEICSGSSPEDFINLATEIEGLENYSDMWQCIEYDYPRSAKTFCRIFKDYVQPEIRKYLKQEN